MRRVMVEIMGGTADEQADILRRMAWDVDHDKIHGIQSGPVTLGEGKEDYYSVTVEEMAEYDHRLLAAAWYGSRFRSHNALARATDIPDDQLALILLGEEKATVKQLNALSRKRRS